MTRVKGAKISQKTRKNVLRKTKGFMWGRSKKERLAREALMHAGEYAFDHRRDKKGEFRRVWQARINAAVRPHGYSYSKFMKALKDDGVSLNRKMLSELANKKPEAFNRLVQKLSS